MDTRRMVIVISLTMAFMFAWQLFIAHEAKLHPEWAATQPATQPATQSASTVPSSTAPGGVSHGLSVSTAPSPATTQSTAIVVPAPPSTAQATLTTAPAVAGGGVTGSATTQPALLTLGSTKFDPDQKGPWAIGVEINPRGAAVERVVLNQFRKRVGSDVPYDFQQPCPVASEYSAALATRSITIDGSTSSLSDVAWRVDSSSPSQAIFSVDLNDAAGVRIATLRKIFKLPQRTDRSLGYDLSVNYSVENVSGRSLNVKVAFNGTNVMAMENNRDAAMILDATDSGDASAHVVSIKDHEHPIAGFKDTKPVDLKEKDKNQPFLWAGVRSNYFDAYLRFMSNEGTYVTLEEAKAFALTPDAKDDTDNHSPAPPPHDVPADPIIKNVVTGYVTSPHSIAAGGTLALPVAVYLGPAARDVLDKAYYTDYPRRYNETLIVSGSCGFLTLPWLVNLLVGILWYLHWAFRDWGLAIIGLVILVRTLLHPISKRSQVSMMKMGKMGPEMEKLKKKYGDDKEGLNKAMMQFYKTQGISPLLGCLPMFLQMPIWIALWSALQSTFEIRHAPFLWGFTWIKDLAQPDRLITFAHPIPLGILGWHLEGINILPLLLAGVSFFQQKVMQPQNSSAMTPEQKQQQKMMKWMSVLLFPLMFYTSPSGLNLYIITSNALAIVEGQIVRKHIREQEEKDKAGLVIVDEPAPEPGRRGGKGASAMKGGTVAKAPATGIAGWMARMQAHVEQLAQQAQKQQKKNKRK